MYSCGVLGVRGVVECGVGCGWCDDGVNVFLG